MNATTHSKRIVVMGIGNTLMQDDGVGVHVSESFRQHHAPHPGIAILDGGTIGLSLLPEIEDADAVVFVDASEIGEAPGTIRIFRNEEIDSQISGKRRTVHEVALADMLSAAAIRGRSPRERVLIAIQPACTELGTDPTPDVQAAIPRACESLSEMTRNWMHAA